jgi:hypothetical protein
MGNDCLS